MMRFFFLLAPALMLAVAVLCPAPARAGTIHDLVISADTTVRIPLGLLGMVEEGGVEKQLAEAQHVLMADLRRSTIFQPRDLDAHLTQSPEETLGRFRIREIGLREFVDVMLWVKLSREAGRYVLEGHIYDSARGQLMGDGVYRYSGDERAIRAMVHRFAGEVIYQYTGEWGITRTRLTFVSDLTGTKEVFMMDHDGYAPVRVTADRNIALTPALNPDTRRILYASQKSGSWGIYELDAVTQKRTVAANFPGLNISPAWHPRGEGYALTASYEGNREIYYVNGSRRATRLTKHPSEDVSPTWSPDGKRIAFTSNRGGSPQIYVMRARGGRPRRLTFEGAYNSEPNWSPKNDLIAFSCRRDGWFHICITTPDGEGIRQLTGGPWDDESPVFSPDGRHIAFSSSRGGRKDIYIMPVFGGPDEVERLTFNGANNTSPDWAGPIAP